MKLSKYLLAVAALQAVSGQALATDVDLVTQSSGTVNGALFFDTNHQSTGTGVIDPFVRLADPNSFADGFNATSRPVMSDVNTSPTFTHDLLLSAIPIVTIGGVAYREFLLDINQTNASPLLSLDQIVIRQGATSLDTSSLSGDANLLSAFQSFGSLVYNLDAGGDNRILLDYTKNNGSGSGDMFMYVNASLFTGQYVYLYSRFGDSGVPYTENDGFEEWATRNPTLAVPEPGTYALMLAGLGAVGYMSRRRRQR